MEWFTKIDIAGKPILKADSRVLLIGSCFSDEISARMKASGMPVTANPFGTQYNPLSIAACLERLLSGEPFTADELIAHNGLYHSSLHHGAFSYPTPDETLSRINEALMSGHEALLDAEVIIVTLGSAWVYEEGGQVVSNCHKRPATLFAKRRLGVTEIVTRLREVLGEPVYQNKQILFTVSPIRHKADGLHENALSKGTLLLAVDELMRDEARYRYFPAYEIMMDELRDYRFYDKDLCHPSEQAVDYIWERVQESLFAPQETAVLKEIAAAKRALAHRPLHGETEQYKAFHSQAMATWKALQEKYPWLEK